MKLIDFIKITLIKFYVGTMKIEFKPLVATKILKIMLNQVLFDIYLADYILFCSTLGTRHEMLREGAAD